MEDPANISEILVYDTPPRSRGEIVSSIFAILFGVYDLYLILHYEEIIQFSTSFVISIIVLMIIVVSLILWGHISVKYRLSNNELVIHQSLGKEVIPIKDITGLTSVALDFHRQVLWMMVPTFTSRDGLMLKLKDNKEIFISPSDTEEFLKLLVDLHPQNELLLLGEPNGD